MENTFVPTPRQGRRRWTAVLAGLAMVLTLGLVAGACGSDSSSSGTPGGTNAAGGGSNDTTPNLVKPAAGPPKTGGKLVYALEAETDGWDPTQNRWATSGTQVALSIFDPLVGLDENLDPQPYLAESLTPSADYKTWTIKLRPNVKFHDGTPLTSAALVKFFTAFKASALTGAAARPILSTTAVDELTVKMEMEMPWATFPRNLTGQAGVIPAPAQLDDKENGTRAPIGTGPFVFKDWTTDKQLNVTKNASYWREGLPYLDSIEFRPIPETQARYDSLRSGGINVMTTSQEAFIQKLLEDGKSGQIQVARAKGDNDANMLLINTTAAPFDDLRVRQAVAYGVDRDALTAITGTDPSLIATGLYTKDSKWYADTGFPTYDPTKAQDLVKQYEAEKGPLTFTLAGTPDPEVVKSVQALQAQLQAIGADVQVQTFEQATFILNAVTGKYQIQVWRQFGSTDPDNNFTWWISTSADGALALNMARNKDPELDAALLKGRGSLDETVRKQAYDEVQKRQAVDLPYIWLSHLRWTLGASNNVRGIDDQTLPNGRKGSGVVGGVIGLSGMWLDS